MSGFYSLIVFPLFFFFFTFLDPRPWPKGSFEIDSVRPFFGLSIIFLGIGSLVFPRTWHGVKGPYIVVRDRVRFF